MTGKGNNILLFGSEGFGITRHTEKYTDFLVKIEINQKIESLNISNSAAIVFHHHNEKRKKYLISLKKINKYSSSPCSSAGRAIDL